MYEPKNIAKVIPNIKKGAKGYSVSFLSFFFFLTINKTTLAIILDTKIAINKLYITSNKPQAATKLYITKSQSFFL